jgi:hypothetical protein
MLNANNFKRICAAALLLATAASAISQTAPLKVTGEDDTEFLFVDKCQNGAAYRLKAYKITVNGESIQMYDYQGPRGTGTIASDVEPRQAKALLCLENKSAWVSSGRQAYN